MRYDIDLDRNLAETTRAKNEDLHGGSKTHSVTFNDHGAEDKDGPGKILSSKSSRRWGAKNNAS